MKIKIKEKIQTSLFRPYKITFFIETEADAIQFHDQIATKIYPSNGAFIGNVYRRISGRAIGTFEADL